MSQSFPNVLLGATHMRVVFFVMALGTSAAACVSDAPRPPPASLDGGASQGSCFYTCNLPALGTSYGCSSAAAVDTDDACYLVARDACGPNTGNTSYLATCPACAASCAPTWYTP